MSAARYKEALAPSIDANKTAVAGDAVASQARAKRVQEEAALRADRAEYDRLRALEGNAGALRHLDGADAVPVDAQRAKALASLEAKIPRREAAIPILRQREDEAERKAADARVPFIGAVMQTVTSIQEPAARRLQEQIAATEDDLCDVIVADMIRISSIGDRYSVPPGQIPPFDGGLLVKKFLSAIPPRLLPPQFTFERLEARARAAATTAIISMKEKRS